ncbi:MAG TPA: hypothetical protein VF516_46360 [Kofleriaceae bacterium]
MRGSALVLVWAACAACHGGGASVDASEPRVYVVNTFAPHGPFFLSSDVSFSDPAGHPIPGTRVPDPDTDAGQYGTVYAVMPDGGSLTMSIHESDSPTSNSDSSWSIAGVKPGDHYRFDGSSVTLPAGCTRRTFTSFTIDATGTQASWDDPDAASVDARIVHRTRGCQNSFPPITCVVTVEVDSSTATTVKVLVSGISTPTADLTSVDVVSCSSQTYDDIRMRLTGQFAP